MKAIAIDDNAEAQATLNAASAQPNPAEDESGGLPISGGPTVLATAPREGTKMARVIAMLQRDQGATLADIIAATGWLPHTTRAALTGLRKRGYLVALDRSNRERGSTYAIERGANPASEKPSLPAIEPSPSPAARSTKVNRPRKLESVATHGAVPEA